MLAVKAADKARRGVPGEGTPDIHVQICIYTPWSKYMANRPQKVGTYRTYIYQYVVTVPSTFTLVYIYIYTLDR